MDLRSGHPYFLTANGIIANYPALTEDARCDVCVIGGGFTGSLVAHRLVEEGHDTLLIEKRDIAHGSTAASTAQLQYEVDIPLAELQEKIGARDAERAYQLGIEALHQFRALIPKLDNRCDYLRKKSLYLATFKKDMQDLEKEQRLRKSAGIRTDIIDGAELKKNLGIESPGGLLSHEAAQIDSVKLTHALLRRATKLGLRAYDRTGCVSFAQTPRSVRITTDRGNAITARRVVFATGYESQEFLKEHVAKLRSTYAFASEPTDQPSDYIKDGYLLWETARPYFYMRSTADGRVMLGGEDEPFLSAKKRDQKIAAKTRRLEKKFTGLFPGLELETAFAWAGTFGETKDGLAYIGETREFKRAHFALGYGGNGMTFSMLASGFIADALAGRKNDDVRIFRFGR